MKKILVASAIISAVAAYAIAAEFIPMGDLRLLSGQYYQNSAPSKLSLNSSFTYVPAVKINGKLSVIPTAMIALRGGKETVDLALGDFVLSENQTWFGGLKMIYAPLQDLKLKAGGSYRREMLREVNNETWGNGLFDYNKFSYGVEAEYEYMPKQTVALGYDLFTIRYPNYETLESSVVASGLGRELAAKNALDTNNQMLQLRVSAALGPVKAAANATLTTKNYIDQPIVDPSGNLITDKRNDATTTGSASFSMPVRVTQGYGIVPELTCSIISNDSTQNHYDANVNRYTADYYDYTQSMAGLTLNNVIGGRHTVVSVGYMYSQQNFGSRLARDAQGGYLSDKMQVNESIITGSLSYPMPGGFKLILSGSYIDSTSNMKYAQAFSYNYTAMNYLAGFTYEF